MTTVEGFYIYWIETSDGSFYIGSTTQPRQRMNCHFASLRRGTHCNSNMQDKFNELGETEFTHVMYEVRVSSKDELLAVEDELIRLYWSWPGRLNKLHGAYRSGFVEHSEETKKRMSKVAKERWNGNTEARQHLSSLHSKPIKVYDSRTGEHVGTYDNARKASESLGVSKASISNHMSGESKTFGGGAFTAAYVDDDAGRKMRETDGRRKPVAVHEIQTGKFIGAFESCNFAQKELGVGPWRIHKCAQGRADSFLNAEDTACFATVLDPKTFEKFTGGEIQIENTTPRVAWAARDKPVCIEFSATGELIGYFRNALKASRYLGVSPSDVRQCANGKSQFFGENCCGFQVKARDISRDIFEQEWIREIAYRNTTGHFGNVCI